MSSCLGLARLGSDSGWGGGVLTLDTVIGHNNSDGWVSANLVKVTKLGQSMVGAISHPKAWPNMVIPVGKLRQENYKFDFSMQYKEDKCLENHKGWPGCSAGEDPSHANLTFNPRTHKRSDFHKSLYPNKYTNMGNLKIKMQGHWMVGME